MTLRLDAPPSKSMTQRGLVIAALGEEPTRIEGPLDCDDSRVLIEALRAFGCEIDVGETLIDVRPGTLTTPKGTLRLGNAGTATRFTACLSLLCDGPFVVDGDGPMRRRPVGPLGTALAALGVAVSYLEKPGCPPIRLERQGVPAERVTIHSSLSSQYASGLAMVAPLLPRGLSLELDGELVSLPYLDMTLAMMTRAGAEVARQDRLLTIAGRGYGQPGTIAIERDWSAAACLLVGAQLSGRDIQLPGLTSPPESLQGDSAIVDLLAALSEGQTTFELTHTPDLIGPLTAACLFADEPVRIRGAAHTRAKECDRVAVLCRELGKTGAQLTAQDDGLDVEPLRTVSASPCLLDPASDHRMAMTFGLVSLRLPEIQVANPECVAKSFPDFWEALAQLSAAPCPV